MLAAPLDVVLAAEVQVPPPHGVVVGGLALGGSPVLDPARLRQIQAPHHAIESAIDGAHRVLSDLLPRLRGDRPLPELSRRSLIVVDDGLETGYRALAAARMLRAHGAATLIIAAPVCSRVAQEWLDTDGVELVCLAGPQDGRATASHYERFAPISDAEAICLLAGVSKAELYGEAEIDG
jgi:putative phosphoribosyl transferase